MQQKRGRDCRRGGIEGKVLYVALVALGAVRNGVVRTTRVGAQVPITAGIENLDRGMLLRSQPHRACARRGHRVVRKEHRREKNNRIPYPARSHFSDISTCKICLRSENHSLTGGPS